MRRARSKNPVDGARIVADVARCMRGWNRAPYDASKAGASASRDASAAGIGSAFKLVFGRAFRDSALPPMWSNSELRRHCAPERKIHQPWPEVLLGGVCDRKAAKAAR
jgi:hypothetical protein